MKKTVKRKKVINKKSSRPQTLAAYTKRNFVTEVSTAPSIAAPMQEATPQEDTSISHWGPQDLPKEHILLPQPHIDECSWSKGYWCGFVTVVAAAFILWVCFVR